MVPAADSLPNAPGDDALAGNELPLFPLQAVLFPDGLLALKVFETRYLDLMARCLRDNAPFGIVALKRGAEVRHAGQDVAFESIGTTAELVLADSAQIGILQVRCRGLERFEVQATRQQADGLWIGRVGAIEPDATVAPTPNLVAAVRGLHDAITALELQGDLRFLAPYRFDEAGWVANRWCEILPIPVAARQRLMELRDPLMRLQIVDEFLRSKQVLG